MLTRSLASTLPKRLVMLRSSSIRLLFHRVGHANLSGDDLLLGCFDGLNRRLREEVLVVLVHGVADVFVVQTVNMNAAQRAVLDAVLYDLIHGVVYALDHAGENKPRFHPVLVGVDAN